MPIPLIPDVTQNAIEEATQAARQAKQHSINLLNVAKRAVEIAIEQDEQAALDFIAGKGGSTP